MGSSIVIGISSGAGTSLLALGIVLIYKTSRTFNFAQGEFGTLGAYVGYLVLGTGLPYGVAIVCALVAGVVLAVAVERLVVWPLRHAARVNVVVATVGIALAATAIEVIVTENSTYLLKPVVRGAAFQLGGVTIPSLDLVIVGCGALVAVLAWIFFNKTMFGTAVLAAADDAVGAAATGIPVAMVSVVMWAVAGLLGALAGVLLAPQSAITPGFMTTEGLVNALAAVVIGGLGSISGAMLGGIVVGLVQAISYNYLGASVPGISEVMTLVLVLAVLIARGHRLEEVGAT